MYQYWVDEPAVAYHFNYVTLFIPLDFGIEFPQHGNRMEELYELTVCHT